MATVAAPARADRARGGRAGGAGDPAAAHAPGRERAARGDRRAAARARAAQRDGAAAADGEAQDRGLQADGRHQGQDRRERGALAAHLALELRAARAAVDVACARMLRRGTRPVTVASCSRISTHGVSRAVARAQQRLAGLEDERLDLLAAHAEHRRDLRVGLVAELEEDQRGALVVGQALQLVDQLAQVGAQLDLGRHALERPGAGREPVDGDLRALRARRADRQRLRAIVYSHGRRSMSPAPPRSAR